MGTLSDGQLPKICYFSPSKDLLIFNWSYFVTSLYNYLTISYRRRGDYKHIFNEPKAKWI